LTISKTLASDIVNERRTDSDREDLIVDESSACGRVSKSQTSAHSIDEQLASKIGSRKSKLQSPVNSGSLKLKLPGYWSHLILYFIFIY